MRILEGVRLLVTIVLLLLVALQQRVIKKLQAEIESIGEFQGHVVGLQRRVGQFQGHVNRFIISQNEINQAQQHINQSMVKKLRD